MITDRKVVRASYESCLNALSRLSAYATSNPILITEVNSRQDILATDDLIDFCIHARRLIDNIQERGLLYKTSIPSSDNKGSLTLRVIIGFIIHHDLLLILRCGTRFRMFEKWLESGQDDTFIKQVHHEIKKAPFSEPITPHILFQSDLSKGMRLINMVTFLQNFSEKVLLEILKKNSWLQDDLFRDLDMTEEKARELLYGIDSHKGN